MTTDQKIDEVLGVVREHGVRLIDLHHLFIEERKLNNDRFTQLAGC